MNRPMTVTQRLGLGFGLILALMLLIAVFAWHSLDESNAAMKSIYEDRTVPMGQLGEIRYLVARDRFILNEATRNPTPAATERHLAEFDANRARARAEWDAYMATYLTPEEAKLAQRQIVDMQAYLNQGLMPAAEALRRQDYDSARQVLATQVAALAPAALQRLSELLALQVTVAKELYETASARNARQLWLIFALGAASGALAIVTTLWVTRRITRQLGAEPHELAAVANRIASGDLTLQARQHAVVEGSVMASMQAMRQTLNHLVHAVRQGVDCVSTASGQIAQGNQDLSARTEAQASSLQQTAASMEELAARCRARPATSRAPSARQARPWRLSSAPAKPCAAWSAPLQASSRPAGASRTSSA